MIPKCNCKTLSWYVPEIPLAGKYWGLKMQVYILQVEKTHWLMSSKKVVPPFTILFDRNSLTIIPRILLRTWMQVVQKYLKGYVLKPSSVFFRSSGLAPNETDEQKQSPSKCRRFAYFTLVAGEAKKWNTSGRNCLVKKHRHLTRKNCIKNMLAPYWECSFKCIWTEKIRNSRIRKLSFSKLSQTFFVASCQCCTCKKLSWWSWSFSRHSVHSGWSHSINRDLP